ncbi:MAG: hypothetical protein M0D57_20585 [Sphingobacteriales bacterium JAD_PAG50586_3]|nr:MAG: hypothetical protein M0D57_20585 [Sphingobacteriales bacterium JAD_PAG50586_3]
MEWFSQKQLSNKLNLIKGSPRVSGEMYVELLNKLKLEENKLPEHKDKIAAADNKRIEAENKLAELNQAITKYNQDSIGKDQQIEYYKKLYDNELIIKNNSKSTFYKSQILTKSLELISGFDLKNNTNHFLQLVNSSIGLIINTEVRSFDVKSDSGTLFLGAHEYPNILSGRAIVKENIPPWSALKNKYLNVFHDCHWISHAENLTIAEEQAGGTYIFVKNVVIYELNRINRINIYSFADDFLEISINNVSPIYPEQGFDLHNNPIIRTFTLVKSQLPDYFVEGVNFIVFKVRNVSIPNAKTINSNPYGIIYKITFEMGEQGADFI